MPPLPALPMSPLSEDRAADLARLTDGLDAPALWWLAGYFSARAGERQTAAPGAATTTPIALRDATATPRATIVYGSQTGNAKRLAEQLAGDIEGTGLALRLVRADAYPTRELKTESLLYVVISTQGDGDPPDDARGFVEFVLGKRAPRLPELKFAVLGLGDSSYPHFNAIGRRLDARLGELGATRIAERGEADLDIETVATAWIERALGVARDTLKAAPRSATVTALRTVAVTPAAAAWSRSHPFAATPLANQRISARDGTRDVRHVELSLEGSNLAYEPGDALGVWPRNASALVAEILETQRLDGDAAVTHAGETRSLRAWLAEQRELTQLARPFVAAHAARVGNAALNNLLAPERSADVAALLATHQVIDLLRAFRAEWQGDELVAALRPLTPRLYSIASSRRVVGDEVHLTVAKVAYEAFGSAHAGAASAYLAGSDDEARIRVYIESNERFRLPKDPATDIIMIGPGTGVAPFRAFVQERAALAARGRNWLFFGNPHFASDFLYQLEWQAARKDGSLHALDLAFSRDEAQKIYVQQRLCERGREVYDWLENGAHVYVCGDATRMARDVHATLIDIVATHGGKDQDAATGYVEALLQDGRYARDVY